MRYNENDGQEINGLIVITEEIEEDSIFENSCVVISNIFAKRIRANYDFSVIGDIEAEVLEVSGSFSCSGNCNISEMIVQGNCSVSGELNVQTGFVGDSITAEYICTENLEVKGSIKCTTLECDRRAYCEKYILASEGIMGDGKIGSPMILCGEYSMIDDTENVVVADLAMHKEGESSKRIIETDIKIDLEKMKAMDREMSSDKFYKELCKLSDADERLKSESNAYKRLMVMENITIPPNLKAYLDIMDIFTKRYIIVSSTKLYFQVKAKFTSWTYEDICEARMPKLTQKEFAKMLHTLLYKPGIVEADIRELILETLYLTIGVDYKELSKTMEVAR